MAKYDLRALRMDYGINQEAMAAKLNVTQGFISRLEQGHNPMSPALEEKFSVVYPDIDLAKYEIDESKVVLNADKSDGSANYKSKITIQRAGSMKEAVACFKEMDRIITEAMQIMRADLENERQRTVKLDELVAKLSAENRELLIDKMRQENTILKLQMRLMQAGLPTEA